MNIDEIIAKLLEIKKKIGSDNEVHVMTEEYFTKTGLTPVQFQSPVTNLAYCSKVVIIIGSEIENNLLRTSSAARDNK